MSGFPKLNFRRDEVYEFSYTVTEKYIVFDAYGTGADPIFTGSDDLSQEAWTNEGGNIYSLTISEPNWVIIDGIRGRASQTAWLPVTAYSAPRDYTVNAASLSGYPSIVGARFINKPREWTTEYFFKVSAYSSGTITIDADPVYQTSIVGTDIRLLAKKEFFDQDKEWAYQDGKLYIYSTVAPSSLGVRNMVRTVGINIGESNNYIEINNIEFRDYYYSAIKRTNSDAFIMNNCEVYNCMGYGVSMNGTPRYTYISNTNVHDCNGGIYSMACKNTNIINCEIYNISVGRNIGGSVDPDQIGGPNRAIFIRDNNAAGLVHTNGEIAYCKLYNLAYNGIVIQSNFKVHHNIIYDFLKTFADGSAIYSFATLNYTTVNSEIYNNIIYNGGKSFCAGIYIDNRAINFTCRNNVIYGIPDAGINVNWDTQFTNLYDNIIVDCGEAIRYRQGGTYSAYQFNQGNICTGNVMAMRSASQFCHKASVFDATVNYNPFTNGSSNNNYYINPYTTTIGTHPQDAAMTFSDLQTRYGTDANSSERVNYKTYVDQSQAEIDVYLLTNETSSDIQVNVGSGYIDVDGNSITTVTVPAYGGYLALKS